LRADERTFSVTRTATRALTIALNSGRGSAVRTRSCVLCLRFGIGIAKAPAALVSSDVPTSVNGVR
jgi:hypothetical protein